MRRFSRGDWKHEAFMDVFFEIVKVPYADSKRSKVRGYWWVMGWVGKPYQPFPGQMVTLVIKAEEAMRWKRLDSRIRTVAESA